MIRRRTRRYIVRHNRTRRRSLDKLMATIKPIRAVFLDRIPKAMCFTPMLEYITSEIISGPRRPA